MVEPLTVCWLSFIFLMPSSLPSSFAPHSSKDLEHLMERPIGESKGKREVEIKIKIGIPKLPKKPPVVDLFF